MPGARRVLRYWHNLCRGDVKAEVLVLRAGNGAANWAAPPSQWLKVVHCVRSATLGVSHLEFPQRRVPPVTLSPLRSGSASVWLHLRWRRLDASVGWT
ncbi:protein of unknown function [Candidatus Filomicrobium marinum]|uniref:Uncharacterized protein n=1 Tax=Candidatus Filomicrobium marinum TaxID=1608628 RepID=A0A0D6JBU8_9HYPH|nr:protein of unknown function [Candidatus Filomicrobium marinum]CPR15782.1 protein of unknown function [Candidatus Filomicrobium marinum]